MDPNSKKMKWMLTAGLLIAIALLYNPLGHLIFSVHLALAMQNFAAGATGEKLHIREEKISRGTGEQNHEALLYQPADSLPTKAIILLHGISALGCYHPKLVSLARHLADRGMMVLTPDIPAFRHFQITAEPIEQIIFWYDHLITMQQSARLRKIGLAGISYSGTLALMAAARTELQQRVSFVVGIGSYCDLVSCMRDWFAPGDETESRDDYPTRYYGRWVAMLAALPMIANAQDRRLMRDILRNYLQQEDAPAPLSGLSEEADRWHRLATLRGGQPDRELAKRIEEYLVSNVYRQLDPRGTLKKVQCPVFLIHGSYDDLIAARESLELHRRIVGSWLLISPFLTHTHLHDRTLSKQKRARSILETLVFCYRFSRIIN